MAQAQKTRLDNDKNTPSLRVASILHLSHNYSVDLYVEEIIANAKIIIIRLLGGYSYWKYGINEICAICNRLNIPLALLPGDNQIDQELASLSTLDANTQYQLWQYFIHGGVENYQNLLCYAADLISIKTTWQPAIALLNAGIYYPNITKAGIDKLPWQKHKPVAAIIFYRALMQAGNLAVINQLIESLNDAGVNALPIYATSLKDPISAAITSEILTAAKTSIILNATSFAISRPNAEKSETPFDDADCPILQVVFSSGNEESWRDSSTGLNARDIAMNVALPEVDGRILSRAVSFKALAQRDDNIQADIVNYQPVIDRCEFVAALAANWARLRNCPIEERKIAIILANYPNRDGRLGNGVGLDTPEGVITSLNAMQAAGYKLDQKFNNGNELINYIAAGPTNAGMVDREIRQTLKLRDYNIFFNGLDEKIRDLITTRWGIPEDDPFYRPANKRDEPTDCGDFILPIFTMDNIAIGLQPARGYNIDPVSSYHDPDLAPPHNYLAFYAWLRFEFNAHAIAHFGKHGNLEWLPGKSIALSKQCFPDAIFGATPHLYPFIVNDPGEGSQAKRRSQAVIIDHMTPPLTRAESYGPLKDLEALVDEYFEAAGVDPRRIKILKVKILELARHIGLDKEAGVNLSNNDADALAQLDNYLCELKELQIRDGLHIFGKAPTGEHLRDLLVALLRVERNKGTVGDASLLRAICKDFGFKTSFDPLDCQMGDIWQDKKPQQLIDIDKQAWRSNGDTIERLEIFSQMLVMGQSQPVGKYSAAVIKMLDDKLRPAVENCGLAELNGLLTGLDGRFVAPGASGAPTRGRLDILPTGRNFYSVDTRVVPTPSAWELGWKSAQILLETYAQSHGKYPRQLALSAWGTANMRTGGDDIAQALALMGVRPTWDNSSRRVTGFEIMPLDLLDRPRVDVTLRISGFFRDAFPNLIELVDNAARAVANLDESPFDNPLAANVKAEIAKLIKNNITTEKATNQAGARVFGSMPGAYGAGLQAMMDERLWDSDKDIAEAYITWGGYAYGRDNDGSPAHEIFKKRLKKIDAVLHNQDNREHDLLDSDDYYQFEGGMTAAVRVLSGEQPVVYHNDHSRPQSPKIRTLEDEIGRIVRARMINPKWIAGVMRHGYKGAFEMAASVDYLFAFAATANCVKDHHFDMVCDAYIYDDKICDFIEKNNPEALKDIADKLQEAIHRNLWQPRRNDIHQILEKFGRNLDFNNRKNI